MIRCVGREVKIESVPPRVARAALQLDETEANGSSFHAQTGRIRQDERGLGPVQIPLAHQYDPRPDLGLYGIRGRFRGPVVAPLWHRLSSDALAWHGLNSTGAPTAA